jgi:chromosome segregation and condensation protein ScpB
MSKATFSLERQLAEAKEYYEQHSYTIPEAARIYRLQNHVTFSNRIHNKHESKAKNSSQNKLLSPA